MQPDYSDVIDFAIRATRRWNRAAFRRWPEDLAQAAALGALQSEFCDAREVKRLASREVARCIAELAGRREDAPGDILRRRCARSARRWDAQQMRALGVPVAEVARRTGLTVGTVNRVTVSSRTPEEVSSLRAAGGLNGGEKGAAARWGDYAERRNRARRMRADGSTLAEIRDACGYKSLSAAHYAVQALKEGKDDE